MENLLEELTAKNKEYVHSVTKQLIIAGKTDDEVKAILDEILPQIIGGQKNGTLAKKLLGTPSEFVAQYTPKNADSKEQSANNNDKAVWMWLDSTLLFFGAITLINGGMGLVSPKNNVSGFTSTLLMSMLAGLVMYMMYKFYYSQTGKRKWNWKQVLIVVGVVLSWGLVAVLAGFLPAVLNPILNAYASLAVGVIALVVKYFVKRKFKIRSALTPVQPVKK